MTKELWFLAPNRVEIRPVTLPNVGVGQLHVRGLFSAVSHGTEGLLTAGQGPPSFDPSLDAPAQATYPRRYGYAWVGTVQTPGEHHGACVFALQPHASAHVLDLGGLRFLPAWLPPVRATLAAAMETALNAVWDAELAVGERVVVFGAGTIGVLVSHVATLAGAEVTVVEPSTSRHETLAKLGITRLHTRAEALPDTFDAVFEATGNPLVLDAALDRCGVEARVIVVSFYGAKTAPVRLGDRFHRRRLRLVSSQVSTIPRSLSRRFDFTRRFEVVCRLLADPRLDALTQHVVPFDDAVEVYAQLDRGEGPQQVIFAY